MALPLNKRYAQYYMDIGKIDVIEKHSDLDAEGEPCGEVLYVATMSEPMKVQGPPSISEHLAKRALAAKLAQEILVLLGDRSKPAPPVPLPKNATGDKGGYAY